ncbi:cell division protein FtsQ [Cypionkella aquatica]|uniref:Cell division protein FtsQ n=1 Tax=Cypionkella aquatica TaxID=1756042 RepID=A0AA37X5T4_9RHOB|nr:cell division protein FtsQ/DivIB [Cypionkella aquatica]GLS88311.1 cell division protein FtsQ [Cypionkella aquatica]
MQSLGRSRSVPAQSNGIRRDPAPTRWQYRMQRLWLTPVFRVVCRLGLPLGVVALIATGVLYSDARRAAIVQGFANLQTKFEQRPEFRVSLLSVEGASRDLTDAVRAKLALKLPQSSFDLDMDALRAKAESLDAVAKAELRVRSGGVLQVLLTERVPVVVWRGADGLQLLDAEGHRVAGLSARADRADLPLVAGEAADAAMPEALAIFDTARPISDRVRGLIRVGERRWDLVLDRDQRIMLPSANPVAAVERLLALNASDKLLERDILSIDLRNQDRPAIRLAPFAMNEVRRAQGLAPTTESGL